MPGTSNSPFGVLIFCGGRKSPVTCTLITFGAEYLKVTELSLLTSGEITFAPLHNACWAKASTVMANMLIITMTAKQDRI